MSKPYRTHLQPDASSRHPVSIGIDYGTASGRVLALDLVTGQELGRVVVAYRHGVIERALPGGPALGPDWALEHPQDYLDVLQQGIPSLLVLTHLRAEQVIGVGIDVTACTVLPVDAAGVPLCFALQWENRPHAWLKLWKHHAAQAIADRMTEAGRTEPFLSRYGGRISSEWYFPKLIQIFEEDPEVYHAMARFIEVGDWLVWHLTGTECRSACAAGYKALWSDSVGLPAASYFTGVSQGFTHPEEKLGVQFHPPGTRAGTIRPDLAAMLGLSADVAVAVANVDAMVSAPAVGLDGPGALVMVMGTSICHLAVTAEEFLMPGVTGVVKDGVLPGWYGYEAGQAAVGDMFGWFVDHAVPQRYAERAAERGLSLYQYLERLASDLVPGQSGLVALDWWNGNRSILGDADLSGVIVGLTLATRPEELYRALLEAVALGTRRIVENFHDHGIALTRLLACGGLPIKSPLLMQIYADVTGLSVSVADSEEIPARGAALYGAVAAGEARGGFDAISAASRALAAGARVEYLPDQAAHAVYTQIYAVYRELYGRLGEDPSHGMHRLKAIRLDAMAHRPAEEE